MIIGAARVRRRVTMTRARTVYYDVRLRNGGEERVNYVVVGTSAAAVYARNVGRRVRVVSSE